MAFVAYTPGEIDADSPLTETFFTKMSDNFDALDDSAVTNGDAHDHSGEDGGPIPQGGLVEYVAGNNLLISSDSDETVISTSPVKKKGITIVKGGALRVKFTIFSDPGQVNTFGRIYVGGSPIGTIRGPHNATPVEYSEDIGSLNPQDEVQIYIWNTSGGNTAHVTNFRVYTAIWHEVKVTS